jgi:hypothetical protein
MVGRLRDFLPAAGICKAFRRQGASPDLKFPYLVWRMRQPPSPPIIRSRAQAVLKPPQSKRWRAGVRLAILGQRRGLRHPLALWPKTRFANHRAHPKSPSTSPSVIFSSFFVYSGCQAETRPKAAEGRRSPRRWRDNHAPRQSRLESSVSRRGGDFTGGHKCSALSPSSPADGLFCGRPRPEIARPRRRRRL